MSRHLILMLVLVLQITLSKAQENGRSALIVLDMQEEFTKNSMDSVASGELIAVINDVIAAARPMDIIFVKAHIKTLNISLKGIKVESSENLDLDGRLYRKKNDPVFMKEKSNAFTIPEFSNLLASNDIKHVFMVGIYLGECLSSTALDGVARGYNVTVIGEGVRAKKASKTKKLMNELSQGGVERISLAKFTLNCHEEAVQ